MLFANVALAALLLVGIIGLLESVSRHVWARNWAKRDYTELWAEPKPTAIRITAAMLAAILAGLAFESLSAVAAFGALAWLSGLAISTDLVDGKIPSEPIWTVLWISLFAISCELALTGSINGNPNALFDMIIAEAVVLGVMVFTVIITVGGIGSADVRLVAALTTLTAWTGAGAVLPALFIAAIGYLITRKALGITLGTTAGDSEPVPFAPGLVAGYAAIAALAVISAFGAPAILLT